jgi:hypothetical protein
MYTINEVEYGKNALLKSIACLQLNHKKYPLIVTLLIAIQIENCYFLCYSSYNVDLYRFSLEVLSIKTLSSSVIVYG